MAAEPGAPRPRRVVGVLGGMGPYATVAFMRNVLDLTPAKKDWDHVHLVVDNHPHIPSRSRALLYNEASPLEAMVEACDKLARYPVDVIALPCNSACHWHAALQKRVKTPVLDLVAIAVGALPGTAADDRPVRRVAALGGMVPWLTDLYRGPLERSGREYVKLAEGDQAKVVAAIESAKLAGAADPEKSATFGALVADLTERYQLDAVILACTEFSFFKDDPFPVAVVDSSAALAQFIVDYAVHGRPLALDVAEVKRFWDARAAMLAEQRSGVLQSTMLTASEEEARAREEREKAALLEHLGPLLGADRRVLELGCGTGRWSRTLARHAEHVDAYDYNATFVELARELSRAEGIENVTYHCADIEGVPREGSYDAVVSVALLHYLDERQFETVLAIARACVRPGGHAVFRETFGVDRRFELHGFYSSVLDTPYHAVYRTVDELAAGLPGFELVTHEMTLPPTDEKPETCQGVAIFRRLGGESV